MIIFGALMAVIGIIVGYQFGFAAGKKVIPESLMGVVHKKVEEIAQKVIDELDKK